MDKYEPRPITHPFIIIVSIVSAAISIGCALYLLVHMLTYAGSRQRSAGEDALEAALLFGPISIASILVFLVASTFGRRFRRPLTWVIIGAWLLIASMVLAYGAI